VSSTDVYNMFGTGDDDHGIGIHNASAVEWNHFTLAVLARLHSVGRVTSVSCVYVCMHYNIILPMRAQCMMNNIISYR